MPKSLIIVKRNPPGKFVVNFTTDSLAKKYVHIYYAKKGIFGRLIGKSVKIVKIPRGYELAAIENNKPNIRNVQITLREIRRSRLRSSKNKSIRRR